MNELGKLLITSAGFLSGGIARADAYWSCKTSWALAVCRSISPRCCSDILAE